MCLQRPECDDEHFAGIQLLLENLEVLFDDVHNLLISAAVEPDDEHAAGFQIPRVPVQHRENPPPRNVVKRIAEHDRVVLLVWNVSEDVSLEIAVLARSMTLHGALSSFFHRHSGDIDTC